MKEPEKESVSDASTAAVPSATAIPVAPPSATPPSSKRQAFDDVIRPLKPEDLASAGTQQIILYMLQQTKAENEQLEGFVERFHEADKRAALLQQQCESERKTSKAIDTVVIGGSLIGGAVFGAMFYFFGKNPPDIISGVISLIIGEVPPKEWTRAEVIFVMC